MRVLDTGNPDLVWPRRFRCTSCDSLLEIELGDVGRDADYTGDFNSYFVTCPACHEQPDLPKEWWNVVTRMRREALNV